MRRDMKWSKGDWQRAPLMRAVVVLAAGVVAVVLLATSRVDSATVLVEDTRYARSPAHIHLSRSLMPKARDVVAGAGET
jgi:hypothetical protein